MKKEIFALMEVAIVLCSVLLVLPVSATEQNQEMQQVSASEVTTASEDDYVLDIYGNANEDDTIDMRDLTYVKLIFFGKKPETELADAKYDGKINPLDFIQIKLIIVGKEKELTIVDSQNKIVTVKKQINRVVVTWRGPLEMLRTIGVKADKIVGVESRIWETRYYETFFSEYQDKPRIGTIGSPDIEKILSLNPDCVFFLFPKTAGEELKSAGIPVIHCFCGIWDRDVTREIKTLGYLFDKRERAEEYIEWREGILNPIKERVGKIPEEDKPKVYFEGQKTYWAKPEKASYIEFAGGKTIFPEVVTRWTQIDPEVVVERNPEVIIKMINPSTSGGATGHELDASDLTKIKEERDEIMNRPELKNVDAVKNGRVYVISMYITSTGACGCRGFLQKIYTAKWLHPDLFDDLDPKAIHQEYLTRFQGLDLDLDEKGVFVYPEPS